MNRICIILLFYSLCLVSCDTQEKRNKMQQSEEQATSIILKFYPTGMIDDVRYSISIFRDSLIVKNYSTTNINGPREYVTLLSNDQMNKINTLTSAIKMQYRNTDIFEGTWGVSLIIDNQTIYEVGDFSFELPPNEIKSLINYLVSLSAIKIDLYGFS